VHRRVKLHNVLGVLVQCWQKCFSSVWNWKQPSVADRSGRLLQADEVAMAKALGWRPYVLSWCSVVCAATCRCLWLDSATRRGIKVLDRCFRHRWTMTTSLRRFNAFEVTLASVIQSTAACFPWFTHKHKCVAGQDAECFVRLQLDNLPTNQLAHSSTRGKSWTGLHNSSKCDFKKITLSVHYQYPTWLRLGLGLVYKNSV